jgi:hypothetical protein
MDFGSLENPGHFECFDVTGFLNDVCDLLDWWTGFTQLVRGSPPLYVAVTLITQS